MYLEGDINNPWFDKTISMGSAATLTSKRSLLHSQPIEEGLLFVSKFITLGLGFRKEGFY